MSREQFVNLMLEDYSFEELIEMFDVSPIEAFDCLFNSGLINEELLKELKRDNE